MQCACAMAMCALRRELGRDTMCLAFRRHENVGTASVVEPFIEVWMQEAVAGLERFAGL